VVDLTPVIIASRTSSSHARSALPDAPVSDLATSAAPAPSKRATATLLRRLADRIDGGQGARSPVRV
jgi:hypothetical protein